MKQVRMPLFISSGEYGQRSRPCLVQYELAGMHSGSLYKVRHVEDAKTGEEYPVDGDSGVLAMNAGMDEMIAAHDPKQVKFAKKELGVDLKNPKLEKKKTPPKPKHENDDLLDL